MAERNIQIFGHVRKLNCSNNVRISCLCARNMGESLNFPKS